MHRAIAEPHSDNNSNASPQAPKVDHLNSRLVCLQMRRDFFSATEESNFLSQSLVLDWLIMKGMRPKLETTYPA